MSNDLENIDPQVFIQHYNTLKNIAKDFMKKPDDLPSENQVGYWYWGKTGAGKTYAALMDFPHAYRKVANNKWWDGYQLEDNVIMDDLDKAHAYMGYHLKIWGDRYAFVAEIKGSATYIRPKTIVVTSNYHPKDIWEDETTLQPILRRFKIVHFLSLGGEHSRIGESNEVRQHHSENVEPEDIWPSF